MPENYSLFDISNFKDWSLPSLERKLSLLARKPILRAGRQDAIELAIEELILEKRKAA